MNGNVFKRVKNSPYLKRSFQELSTSGALTIKAKDFANEVTNVQVVQRNLRTENNVTREHVKNNLDVRKILTDRNIVPEKLPRAEDVKKLERRFKSEEKKLPKQTAKLKER